MGGADVTVHCFAFLLVYENGNSGPKFPSDNSLGAVDLDHKVFRTCETQEFGGISLHLFDHNKI